MKIAISKGSGSEKYLSYAAWLRAVRSDTEIVDLSLLTASDAVEALESCAGILLSGGWDIHPSRYDKADESERCQVDVERDNLEFPVVQKARELNMPILGICRGLQILNVAFGGTLIVDIPADRPSTVDHQKHSHIDSRHSIEVESGSLIKKICGVMSGEVNSSHHQAVDTLAGHFSVSARSDDGLIEAFETAEPTGNSFILAVQWHPERLEPENPFSLPIARHFLFECESYQSLISGRYDFSRPEASE